MFRQLMLRLMPEWSAAVRAHAGAVLLKGEDRDAAIFAIKTYHYTQSVSSGKTHYLRFQDAIVAFSIPANKNVGKFLLGRPTPAWELSRMWAPDGHERNLLTQAISACVDAFHKIEPACEVLVSYADPNAGHTGGVYLAASWLPIGRCEENRYYIGPNNEIAARRKFHSGRRILRKAEIEALGYTEAKLAGKNRFARGLTRKARSELRRTWGNGIKATPLF